MIEAIQMYKMVLTDSISDFEQIIELNKLNNLTMVSKELWAKEGFLSLEFDTNQLNLIRGKYKHVVAKVNNEVVGYALVMLKEKKDILPFFDPMFETVKTAIENGHLDESQYFVMAQICVAKKYRGQGVFRSLYDELAAQMKDNFSQVVIEVSPKNTRSMIAHAHIGFKDIMPHESTEVILDWNVLLWEMN